MEKLCPFNGFSPCKGEKCAASIKSEDGSVCSLTMIAHELFVLTDIKLQESAAPPLLGAQECPEVPEK